MNFRTFLQSFLLGLLVAAPIANAQLISVDVLGVGVDVTVPGAGNGEDDISILSLDVLSEDAVLGAGIAGQDILLLGAPASPLDVDAGTSALAPLLDNLGGDSSVIEFLQDTAGDGDIIPEVLTIDLSDETQASEEGTRVDGRRGKKPSVRSAAAAKCRDVDQDSVCDEVDRCPDSPAEAVVLPSGCHLEVGRTLRLVGVSFASDTALLNASSAVTLRQAANILTSQRFQNMEIEVVGHTDDRGDTEYNMRLSLARAEAVVSFLMAEGVEAERMKAIGFGEKKPKVSIQGLSDRALAQARAENRRVEMRAIEADLGSKAR